MKRPIPATQGAGKPSFAARPRRAGLLAAGLTALFFHAGMG